MNQRQLLINELALISNEQHTEQSQIIRDSNNISEIKKFAHNLAETGVLYDFKPVIDYAQQLNERISIFDTQGIKQQLEIFSSMQAQLLELKKPVTSAELK